MNIAELCGEVFQRSRMEEGADLDPEIHRRRVDVEWVVRETLQAIRDHIEHDDTPVRLRGLGTFHTVQRRERRFKSRFTGKMETVPPCRLLRFKVADTLHERMNKEKNNG